MAANAELPNLFGVAVLLFLLFFITQEVNALPRAFCSPTPPRCADDCEGNGYYLSGDGNSCLRCPSCPAGQALSKPCGNGRHSNGTCSPCPEGTFSVDGRGDCTMCTSCVNTVETSPCESSSDRTCGDCLPGYYRGSDRFAHINSCPYRCADAEPDNEECNKWAETRDVDPNEQCSDPVPPVCADDCHGNRYYLGKTDGLCKMCVQCQPGEALDKECGNGKNGDARCLPCDEGTFSPGGTRHSCTPCRICVNSEVLKACDSTSDAVCGSCLPGFFQDADNPGAFFDSSACPNRCADNPRNTPQCQEWWEAQETDRAPPTDAIIQANNEVDQQPNVIDMESGDLNIGKSSQEDNPSGHSRTYIIVVITLASILVIVLVLGIAAFFHYLRRSSSGQSSGSGESAMLPESTESTPRSSPGQSPNLHPSRVYNPTVYSPQSQFPEESVFRDIFRRYMPDMITEYMQGSRPSSTVSSHGTPSTQNSSALSTPVSRLRSECHQALLPPQATSAEGMESRVDGRPVSSNTNITFERQTIIPQSTKVITENPYGDAVPLYGESGPDAAVDPSNGRVRRRSIVPMANDNAQSMSSVNGSGSEKNGNGHHGNKRRKSVHLQGNPEPEAALNSDSDSSKSFKKVDLPGATAKVAQQPGVASKDVISPKAEETNKTRPEESSGIHGSASGNVNIKIILSPRTVEKVQIGDEHNHYDKEEEEETAPFIPPSSELDDYDSTERSSFLKDDTFED
ncbi:uncharacterized protein [Diadema setosum]|uniref:uncharacterized protein n=1 Tax=Diadema setosum TaxID=31175 RepID=UPI003B3A5696